MKHLWYVSLPYATFGIISDSNCVVSSAPIACWTIGKNIDHVLTYFRNKGAQVLLIEEDEK